MNYRRLFVSGGFVFITIVTYKRIPILTKNIRLLKQGFHNVAKYYDFQLIAYSVQPDHIHCIIKPSCIDDYPKIIKSFKYSVTKLFNVGLVKPTYITAGSSKRQFVSNINRLYGLNFGGLY